MTRTTVRTDLSAKVWKVVAAAGQTLEADDPIIILESMKMEIPVPAPSLCRVVEILVNEGDTVRDGDPVAVVEIRISV
jgi:biotin carboxyl carrier protein